MAVFGSIVDIKEQYQYKKELEVIFEYLLKATEAGTEINNRILALECDQYEKIALTDTIFVIEQSYVTRLPQDSFFEAHKKYVDFQCMVQEKESMFMQHISNLKQTAPYNEEDDYTKFGVDVESSNLIIDAKNLAIFFPYDGHMPAIQVHNQAQRIFKTVVKVPIELFENK